MQSQSYGRFELLSFTAFDKLSINCWFFSLFKPYSLEDNTVINSWTSWVSSHDQKEDLVRQSQVLELYCAEHGYKYELITDLGSGMNYYKKGLTNLINQILNDEVKRLVITHKDRLLRFGAELIFSICEAKEVEVVIINKGQEIASTDEELTQDVQEFITVLSSRLYGLNSKKNQQLIDNLSKAVNDNNSNLP